MAAATRVDDRRRCLTGTPIQLIQKPSEDGHERGLSLVQNILRPIMLRRTKFSTDREGRIRKDFYDALFKRSKVKFDQFLEQGRVLHNYASILELLLRLRQCCDHPFLVSRGDTQELNKFFTHIQVTTEEFFPQWRSLSGPPLKHQEVRCETNVIRINGKSVQHFEIDGLSWTDPNAFNLVASTTFYSESTRAMLCLVRIETDPADRTQLHTIVASADPTLTFDDALGEKNFDKHSMLKLLGDGMVRKCGRLPLALKALGRVLKGNRNGDEWEKLLNSEIWDIDDESEILPALRLSYYHLPPHLKQLFAYCSLFPKDYVFHKNALVLMWMGEGFLSQSKSMESLGNRYFEELQSRSFFQLSTNDHKLTYTMHDLINDLATSVAGEFFCRLDAEMDVSDTNETFEKFRHFSRTGLPFVSYRKLQELTRATRLRTFFTVLPFSLDNVHVELLHNLHFLRVLKLTGPITEVPQSVGRLKHLRYLSLSNTLITCLPEEVSDLYNLQSLFVHNCPRLSSLPGSFAKLINLRHLGLIDTPNLNKMPLGIARLSSLQTLSKVMIEEGNGFKISDLKGLSDLQGRLSIMGLEKVINPMQAKDANLHQKKGLDVLEMDWGNEFNDSRNEMIEYEVLQELRPHPKLKILKILFYKGTKFPSWVSNPSFDQLTELTLCGSRSTYIPTLGHLQSLKKLVVERMNEVKTVGFEFLAPTNSFLGITFPSLEVLTFKHMKGWQRWSIDSGDDHRTSRSFPRLHQMYLINCPELAEVSIGLIPSLRVLYIEECSEEVLKGMVGVSVSLVTLKMLDVKGLTHLHSEDLIHLGTLEVGICRKLVLSAKKEVDFGIRMLSLKEVTFSGCDALESYNCPNSVESLEIRDCDSLTSLTFSSVQEHPSPLTESIINDCTNIKSDKPIPMSRLTSLRIRFCKNLKSFAHEYLQHLTSLEDMWIYECPSMDYSFPCGVWPANLTELWIGHLNKPMSEWGQQNFPTSLVELILYGENSGVVSFEVANDVRNITATPSSSFLLPPSLVSLELHDFVDVESFSEVLQHLPCLKNLEIRSCPKITDLSTTYDPSNLTIDIWE
ncbi:hypothetical protein Lser_V15G03618 [Lactuca serriola]